MKITDFAPRTGALEYYLKGQNLSGVEVGSDIGAHAESILTHCSIEKLHLVDTWENIWCKGYCEGRLARWHHKVKVYQGKSNLEVLHFGLNTLDFVYLDQQHDYNSVKEDLKLWWQVLREGGIMVLRNYADSNTGLKKAADEFCNGKQFKVESYHAEILVWK